MAGHLILAQKIVVRIHYSQKEVTYDIIKSVRGRRLHGALASENHGGKPKPNLATPLRSDCGETVSYSTWTGAIQVRILTI